MKFALSFAWLSLVAGVTAASYDGYQVHRVKTGPRLAWVKQKLDTIPHQTWEQTHGHSDVLIPRDQVDAFEALGLQSRTLHADLGHSITKEAQVKRSWKRQSNDTVSHDPWFDSYHPYDDVCKTQERIMKGYPLT